jgi:predicted ATPase
MTQPDRPSLRHFERVVWSPNARRLPRLDEWPYSIPAVAQIIAEGGLEIPAGITILVGENGSGKSTIIEALAAIYPRKGFENPFAMVTGVGGSEEDSPLQFHLKAKLVHMASRAGFFLRAESMHAFLASVDRQEKAFGYGEKKMQAQSHGESFLDVLRHRFEDVGVYFLDEPEAALSFQSSLALLSLLNTMRQEGSQVIVSTHSPILASLPGATILELGDHGFRVVKDAEDLALIQHWRSFLDSPGRYLRHLFADQ